MKNLKDNLPLILLLSVVPYFFYATPTLAQSVIAASLAALVGFKYSLEHKSQPDYVKIFEDKISKRDGDIKAHIEKLVKELEELREKQSIKGVELLRKNQREAINW